jgi:hypothetical protein
LLVDCGQGAAVSHPTSAIWRRAGSKAPKRRGGRAEALGVGGLVQAAVQAQLGISRDRLGGVLTSLAGARKRVPRDVDYSIRRDRDLRRYRIEPVAAELLLAAVERARAAGLVIGCGAGAGRCVGQDIAAATLARDLGDLRRAQRSAACSPRLPGVAEARFDRPMRGGGRRRRPDQQRPSCRSGRAWPGCASRPAASGRPRCPRPLGRRAPRYGGTRAGGGP